VKRIYCLSEKQYRLTFGKADRQKGVTGINLLTILEKRLDNVVYRMGFVNSRTQGRHFVRHGHFLVNGKSVDIPSYQTKVGDIIEIREKSRKIQAINDALDAVVRRGLPQWIELDKDTYKATIKGSPAREDITTPIQEQLIVELYSK
jgi:small subunit ribosomal protein S4